MVKLKTHKRGIALFIVLGTVLIITILANIILNTISSQSRLTHHQVSRILAYYATMAGMNLAIERLRIGTWEAGNDCTPAVGGCWWTFAAGDFQPASIVNNRVLITIWPPGSNPPGPAIAIAGAAPIIVTADYAYTP